MVVTAVAYYYSGRNKPLQGQSGCRCGIWPCNQHQSHATKSSRLPSQAFALRISVGREVTRLVFGRYHPPLRRDEKSGYSTAPAHAHFHPPTCIRHANTAFVCDTRRVLSGHASARFYTLLPSLSTVGCRPKLPVASLRKQSFPSIRLSMKPQS
jgi:hypothetical protein